MVQIHSNCENCYFAHFTCLLEHELGFSHYQGPRNDRAVFKPVYTLSEVYHQEECTERYVHTRNSKSRSVDDLRLPLRHYQCNYSEKVGGKHVDLPPCQIQIKWVSNDTELPGLQVDFEKGEISFEWQAMLERFFREAAILDKHDCALAAEAMQWLKEEDRSMTAVLLRTWKDRAAREQCRMGLRQFRIKKWYRDLHNHEHSGIFDADYEDMTLVVLRCLEWPKSSLLPLLGEDIRSEDKEEARFKASRWEANNMLRRMEIITETRGASHGYGDYLDGDWETLSAKAWAAETYDAQERLEHQILFPNSTHNRHLWPNVVEDQTEEVRALACDLEDPSAKAEREKRREREWQYCEIWLGRARI